MIFYSEIPYEIEVHTSDVRGSGTNANVFIVLYGEKGKSDEFWLRNKTDNFERGQIDKFKVNKAFVIPGQQGRVPPTFRIIAIF